MSQDTQLAGETKWTNRMLANVNQGSNEVQREVAELLTLRKTRSDSLLSSDEGGSSNSSGVK